VRTVFIIGPDKRVRLTMAYPMSVGRNFQEILRTLDAIQLTDREFVATPADWVPGRDVVVSLALNDVQATERFGPLDVRFPYLRLAKAPK
jgi:alkyl hydroperoxide reductase subunit AhpC